MKNEKNETKLDVSSAEAASNEETLEADAAKKATKKTAAKKTASPKKSTEAKTSKSAKQAEPVVSTASDSILNSLYPSSTISTAEGTIGATPVAGLSIELSPLTKEEARVAVPAQAIKENPTLTIDAVTDEKDDVIDEIKKEKTKKKKNN